jgi:hypothetical protein
MEDLCAFFNAPIDAQGKATQATDYYLWNCLGLSLLESQKIVANCHKMPQEFDKELLSIP